MVRWTKEQKVLLFSNMTNEAIASSLGKNVSAVKKARLRYTGHTVEREKWKTLENDRVRSVVERMRLKQGEAHVVQTAMRIGAKIQDVR